MKRNLLTIGLALVAMFTINVQASAEDKVTNETYWDFESYQAGYVISNEIKSDKGLYLRGSSAQGHDIVAEIHKRQGKYSDGTPWKIRMAASINGNPSLKKDITAKKRTAGNENQKVDRCFAMNTTVPGTLTVLISPRKAVDDKEIFLIFDTQVVATADPSEDKVYELTYKADKPGVFWFGADCQYFVYAVKFTPAQ